MKSALNAAKTKTARIVTVNNSNNPTHGGARPGAGRKPKDYVRLSLDLAPADYERVKELAESLKITPRKWMIERIVSGL